MTTQIDIQRLAEQFFSDCTVEGISPGPTALQGWLWFTCPAYLRAQVRPLIEADARMQRSA